MNRHPLTIIRWMSLGWLYLKIGKSHLIDVLLLCVCIQSLLSTTGSSIIYQILYMNRNEEKSKETLKKEICKKNRSKVKNKKKYIRKNDPDGIEKFSKDFPTIFPSLHEKRKTTQKNMCVCVCVCKNLPILFFLFIFIFWFTSRGSLLIIIYGC